MKVGKESLHLIFSTILDWHYSIKNDFSTEIKGCLNGVIAATLDIYNEAKNKLLPTPTKSHYTFNLRDYARVIQVYFYSII
jgi:dynein heavy chain